MLCGSRKRTFKIKFKTRENLRKGKFSPVVCVNAKSSSFKVLQVKCRPEGSISPSYDILLPYLSPCFQPLPLTLYCMFPQVHYFEQSPLLKAAVIYHLKQEWSVRRNKYECLSKKKLYFEICFHKSAETWAKRSAVNRSLSKC